MDASKDLNRADRLDKLAAEFIPTAADIEEVTNSSTELIKQAVFDWDAALDSYDPSFPNYTPSMDVMNFFNLMRLVAGSDFEVGNSLAQYFMLDVIFGNVTPDMYPYSKDINETILVEPDRIAICCSRGLSKSTLLTNFLFIYVAIMGTLPNAGKQRFWLALGSSSKGHARNMALSLKAVCEESIYMNDIMEKMHFTETEATFLRKGDGSERDRYFVIRFLGIFTPSRGQKSKYNDRPDVAVLDDCIPGQAAAYSKTIMQTYETALHSDLGNALKANGGKIFNVFTPFNYNEPNSSSILNGSFTPVLIPVARAFKDPENLKLADIESSWEQMHTPKAIHKMWSLAKRSKTLSMYMQERMLRLTSAADRLIPDSAIQFCNMKPIADHIDNYTVYITTDYTTTSGEKSDFSGIATWAVSNNGDYFLLNLTLRKRSMEEQYNTTLDEAAMWKRKGKHVELGVEVDGNQQAHIYSLEQLMAKRGDFYSFMKEKANRFADRKGLLSRSTGVKKHERFRIAAQSMLQGKVWFPEHIKDSPDMVEFIQQIKGATHTGFTRADDGPDLLTMLLVTGYIIFPNEVAMEDKKSMDVYNPFYESDVDTSGAYESYV